MGILILEVSLWKGRYKVEACAVSRSSSQSEDFCAPCSLLPLLFIVLLPCSQPILHPAFLLPKTPIRASYVERGFYFNKKRFSSWLVVVFVGFWDIIQTFNPLNSWSIFATLQKQFFSSKSLIVSTFYRNNLNFINVFSILVHCLVEIQAYSSCLAA